MKLNLQKTAISAAILGILSTSSFVQAAIPVKIATEAPASEEVTLTAGQLEIAGTGTLIGVQSGTKIDGSALYFLGLRLTGNARFSSSISGIFKAKCVYTAGTVTSLAASINVNTISISLPEGKLATANCNIYYSATGVHTGHILISASLATSMPTITYESRFISPPDVNTATTVSTALFEAVQAAKVTYVPTKPVVDVSNLTPSTIFIQTNGSNTGVISLGEISYNLVPGITVANVSSAGSILSVASITVSGIPIGAATTVSGQTGGIFLSSTADCSTAISGASVTAPATDTQFVTFSGVGVADLAAGVHVCFKANGITAIPKGQTYAVVTATTSVGGFTPNTSVSDTAFAFVDKNGSSAKVYNLPNNAVADNFFIRIYNLGGKEGIVRASVYSQGDAANLGAGEVIGMPNVELGTVPAGGVLIVDTATLAAKIGVTAVPSWPGRAWMQLESELTNMRVQALVRTGGGTLVNVSTVAGE